LCRNFSEGVFNCCDRKSRAACAQGFALWQQATIEIMRRNLSYCLLAPRIYIFVLRAHPVRGESQNQGNTTGEGATTSPPFCNEPHRSHVLCVKAELGTTSTSWSQYHFVAIGNPERHVRKASHCGSKQQQRSPDEITIISCSRHIYRLLFFEHIPFVVSHIQRNATGEVATQLTTYSLRSNCLTDKNGLTI